MIIYPAIDILDGNGVRLKKGKFNEVKVYGKPLELAKTWEKQGSDFIHIVDLNGAKQLYNNKGCVLDIIKETNLEIQFGGGIRSIEYARELLKYGVKRIILGTVAIKDKSLLDELLEEYGDRIIVGIDAINGMVAVEGWREVSTVSSLDIIDDLIEKGVKYVVYTDISKDGMLQGPNFDVYRSIVTKDIKVIASGGITTLEDVMNLREIGVYGAIIGKALYEKRIDLMEVLNAF